MQRLSVQWAIHAFGPNVVLASLSLDEFRANFKSENEAKKVPLMPLTASEKQVRLITDTGEKNNCWWL